MWGLGGHERSKKKRRSKEPKRANLFQPNTDGARSRHHGAGGGEASGRAQGPGSQSSRHYHRRGGGQTLQQSRFRATAMPAVTMAAKLSKQLRTAASPRRALGVA